jgi:hypothetical protein
VFSLLQALAPVDPATSLGSSTSPTSNDGYVLLAIAAAAVTLVGLATAVRTLLSRRVSTHQPPTLPGWEAPRRRRR